MASTTPWFRAFVAVLGVLLLFGCIAAGDSPFQPFDLPPLPYAYEALEPFISRQTMQVHHTAHHQAYTDNLNKALEELVVHPKLRHYAQRRLEDLLRDLSSIGAELPSVARALRNHGGGYYNHALFWRMMKPPTPANASEFQLPMPSGKLLSSLIDTWGSFAKFQDSFSETARTLFGSGWVWLYLDKDQREPRIGAFVNQDSPSMDGHAPLLGLDVWEHAYYLQYQSKRPEYIRAWWHIVNWGEVEVLYQRALVQPRLGARPLAPEGLPASIVL